MPDPGSTELLLNREGGFLYDGSDEAEDLRWTDLENYARARLSADIGGSTFFDGTSTHRGYYNESEIDRVVFHILWLPERDNMLTRRQTARETTYDRPEASSVYKGHVTDSVLNTLDETRWTVDSAAAKDLLKSKYQVFDLLAGQFRK
jgi:hypothetical protein